MNQREELALKLTGDLSNHEFRVVYKGRVYARCLGKDTAMKRRGTVAAHLGINRKKLEVVYHGPLNDEKPACSKI